jgi:hypothetical protein
MIKILPNFFITNYIFKFSSLSKKNSTSSNSFNFASTSISSSKLEKVLHPILGSMNQFLLIKFYLFKLFDCKWHLLRIISIHAKKNLFNFNLWTSNVQDLTNKESNCRKHRFMLLPTLKKTYIWNLLKIKSS